MGMFSNQHLNAKLLPILEKPHFGILTGDNTDELTAIPPGAILTIVENAKRHDGQLPLIIESISFKRLTFLSVNAMDANVPKGKRRRYTFDLTKNEAF